MRAPRLLALGLFALAAGAAPAQAGVVVGEGVPFTAEELADAIEARSGEPVGDVHVERSPGADLRVITPDGTWDVAVGEAHGPVAARFVALHLIDRQGLGAIALPPRARVALAPSRTPLLADLDDPFDDAPAPARRARGGATSWLTFAAGAARGTDATDLAAFATAVELARANERWIAAAELGLDVSARSTDAGDVRWVAPHGRLGVGRQLGSLEVVGSVLVTRFYFENVPDRPVKTVIGFGGSARFVVPVGLGPWRLVAGVGADLHQNRVMIQRSSMTEASTPRVSLAAHLGLSKELGR